jgi:hypothetical protein
MHKAQRLFATRRRQNDRKDAGGQHSSGSALLDSERDDAGESPNAIALAMMIVRFWRTHEKL